jgi:hypothetical protein
MCCFQAVSLTISPYSATALTTILILRQNTRGNRRSDPQQDGGSETTLLAPFAAHSHHRQLTKSPTSPEFKSRRNAVYFPTSPLIRTQTSIEQLTRSPLLDDEVQEQKDEGSFFFVVNIEDDQSVEFCHLPFDQDDGLYGNDGECEVHSDCECLP